MAGEQRRLGFFITSLGTLGPPLSQKTSREHSKSCVERGTRLGQDASLQNSSGPAQMQTWGPLLKRHKSRCGDTLIFNAQEVELRGLQAHPLLHRRPEASL